METNCCNAESLHRLLDHQLTGAEESEVLAHLSHCSSCQQTLESLSAEPEFWHKLGSGLGQSRQSVNPLEQSARPTQPSVREQNLTLDNVQPPNSTAISEFNLATDEHLDVREQTGFSEIILDIAASSPDQIANEPQSQDQAAALQFISHWLAPTDDPQYVGRLGAYEIVGVIGVGGMGIVLKGYERALHRCVAIKVLGSHLTTSGAARRRFQREAQAAASVVHENVLAIHAIDQWRDVPYFVMPLVHGESLEKRLKRCGPFSLLEILRIGRQVAAGLFAAHQQGVVHRDIKPANILMEHGSERLAITDFGLARAGDDASITRSGFIMGTPLYMSPEQARGERVDARSDIFSFGSLLYALCTGHAPFRAETPYGVIRRLCDEHPREIQQYTPAIPLWLSGIVNRMMHKDVKQRVQSADELQHLFTIALAFAQQPPDSALPPELKPFVRSPVVAGQSNGIARLFASASVVVAVLAVCLVGAAVWKWTANSPADNSRLLAGSAQLGKSRADRAIAESSVGPVMDDSEPVSQDSTLESPFRPLSDDEKSPQVIAESSSNSSTKQTDAGNDVANQPSLQTNSASDERPFAPADAKTVLQYSFAPDEQLAYAIDLELCTEQTVMAIQGKLRLKVAEVMNDAAELNYQLNLTQEMRPRTLSAEEQEALSVSRPPSNPEGEIKIRTGASFPAILEGMFFPGPIIGPPRSPFWGGPFAASSQPFSFEMQEIQNCQSAGRAKISTQQGWLGASDLSELPGHLGPALVWVFPALGQRGHDGVWHAENSVQLSVADPSAPENWSVRKSLNCLRTTELRPKSITGSKQINSEFSIADRLTNNDAPTQTLLGTLRFDSESGKLEQLDIVRSGFSDDELIRESKIRKLRLQIRRLPTESKPE